MMLLTQSTTPIIGQVAMLLGYIMNGIFWLQSKVGLENIGLCIIFFTIVIYVLMLPLTVQQQKFSKLQALMNPELQAVQAKYKDKKGDQAAMARMQEETQAVYEKYGVNPMGSCGQLVVQLPILYALYQVIWNIPAYVGIVKNAFLPLSEKLMEAPGAEEFLSNAASGLAVKFPSFEINRVIDVLYKFKPANWESLAQTFPDLSELVTSTQNQVDKFNYFLGLNIAQSPANIIMESVKNKAYVLVVVAAMIPILAAVTQWLNTKLMTVDNNTANSNDNSAMASSMKTMNNVMPIMSAVFCTTLPVGLGLYWIAGAVVRSIMQVLINKHLDKVGMDAYIEKSQEKARKKREKRGFTTEQMKGNATLSTRNMAVGNTSDTSSDQASTKGTVKTSKKKSFSATESSGKVIKAKPGSMAEKAMMVNKYNEEHTKK